MFGRPRERQRQRDDDDERLDEWPGLDELGDLPAHEQPEIQREQHQLDEHQRRRRGRNLFGITAGEFGERDDVIDTRRQQHHERPHEDDRLLRKEPREAEYDDRHDHEVQPQRSPHEPAVPERPSDPDERDLEERDVQQHRKHGVDERFQHRARTRQPQSDRNREEDDDGVYRELLVLNPVVRERGHTVAESRSMMDEELGASKARRDEKLSFISLIAPSQLSVVWVLYTMYAIQNGACVSI